MLEYYQKCITAEKKNHMNNNVQYNIHTSPQFSPTAALQPHQTSENCEAPLTVHSVIDQTYEV